MSDHRVFDPDHLLLWHIAMLNDIPDEQAPHDLGTAPLRRRYREAAQLLHPELRNMIISRTVRQLHEIVSRHVQQTGDDRGLFLSYEFLRAQLHDIGHNGNQSSVSNRAVLNAYRPGRWLRYVDHSGRSINVEKMMASGGSGEDMARPFDPDCSSADDVDEGDDDDERSISTDRNDDHTIDNFLTNGSDNNEVCDRESQYSDDDEPHEDPYCICDRCVNASHDGADGVDGSVISVSSFVSIFSGKFKRPRRAIQSMKAFFGRFIRCQCTRPASSDD